ncbi:MAG: hypothetical protein GY805_31145 [Chloroflexi bacterium]|nr:hypothetical protein [Chloroflexota bacterium]
MKKNPLEPLLRAEKLIAQQFDDAPRELNAAIDLAMNALQQDNFGDALNLLNRAHDLAEKNNLEEWKAEVSAAWAVYYFRTGDKKEMYQAISYAQRREPENRRIAALMKVISDGKG